MILQKFPLEFQWQTQEPFLFCVHHLDHYPEGTSELGPHKELLKGRDLGQDFSPKNGFRMYHGETVPGFPVHPHRGFETVTIVRQGYADHADSLGAAGRYGQGDVQWMTAGRGVQHSEMFPLLNSSSKNTLDLFQIWINLPRVNKIADPDYRMFWNERIPVVNLPEQKARITIIAGELKGTIPLDPPPASWANIPESETAIWLIQLGVDGHFEIPASKREVNRSLYFYEGETISISGEGTNEVATAGTGLYVESQSPLTLRAQGKSAEILLLQSRPIGEPVAQYGPFVMSSREEIMRTFQEYQRTQFGGWPWPRPDMVHGGPEVTRFAKYPDGRVEKP